MTLSRQIADEADSVRNVSAIASEDRAAPKIHAGGATMKILVAIASWGTKNDPYLARLIQEYDSMSFDVDVVVLSNLPKPVGPGAKVFLVDLKGKDPCSLPFAHKKIFADHLNDYDLFIYSEDDTLITESNIRAYLKACTVLEGNEIAGFFRFERGTDGLINYPEVHGPYHWDCQSVRLRKDNVFASFTNEHSACYVLTRDQLERAISSGGFLVEAHGGKYDLICTAATDPYTQCGFEKVIGISPLEDFLVHHLPNIYIGTTFGVGESELRSQVQCLAQIAQNGHPPTPLFPVESKLMHRRFSKDCYEKPQREIIDAIPHATKTLLSVGCGSGATEASLVEQGLRVVALPVDPVFASGARAKGVEVVEGDVATARTTLEGEQFDCLLVLDVLQIVADPTVVMSAFVPLLRVGGTVIVRVPVVHRLTTAYRVLRGDQGLKELGIYETTGIHFNSRRIVRRWLEKAGLRVVRVETEMPSSFAKVPRALRRTLHPIWALKMGARMVFAATKR
jgi:2-polyprenyl-3-methyl-5-hydroxy-6-metoxy-1,4-benzoquinol methylase